MSNTSSSHRAFPQAALTPGRLISISHRKLASLQDFNASTDHACLLRKSILIFNALALAQEEERVRAARERAAEQRWYESVVSRMGADEEEDEHDQFIEHSSYSRPHIVDTRHPADRNAFDDDDDSSSDSSVGSSSSTSASSTSYTPHLVALPPTAVCSSSYSSSAYNSLALPTDTTFAPDSDFASSSFYGASESDDDEDSPDEAITPPQRLFDDFDFGDAGSDEDDGDFGLSSSEERAAAGLQLFAKP